jgi:hypothetical protein
MQETDMWIDPLHYFSVEFEDQPQYAVRGRVLGAEIDGEIPDCRRSAFTGVATRVICRGEA